MTERDRQILVLCSIEEQHLSDENDVNIFSNGEYFLM